ncbi:MAG: FG-GAP repeat protein, partial [Planctomycetota bacterium]|nr:FG-GAP repeat protein [Planctomycetota bacterium]
MNDSFLVSAAFTSSFSDLGRVHIYKRGIAPGSWILSTTFLGRLDIPFVNYGWDIDLDQDRLIIAALTDTGAAVGSGAAYTAVYNPAVDAWQSEDRFFPMDGAEEDMIYSVAISGDLALLGSPNHSHGGIISGAAYAFHFDGSNWIQEAELLPSDAANGDLFGKAVELHGNTAVIYSPRDALGSIYVFRRIAGSWVESGKIKGPDNGFTGISENRRNIDF